MLCLVQQQQQRRRRAIATYDTQQINRESAYQPARSKGSSCDDRDLDDDLPSDVADKDARRGVKERDATPSGGDPAGNDAPKW